MKNLVIVESLQQIKRDQTINTILIFRVKKDKKVRTNSYVLYYQEINGGNDVFLRKIKLKIADISKLKEDKKLKLTQKMPIKTNKIKDTISIERVELKDSVLYSIGDYVDDYYSIEEHELPAKMGYKILNMMIILIN